MTDVDPTRIDISFDPREQRMVGVAYHGNTPFDVPFITEIHPGLWQGGCETGLILPGHIKHIVSLYPWEKYTINHQMKSEMYVRMYDSVDSGPGLDQIRSIAEWVNHLVEAKDGDVLVHCQAGLNRSSFVVATALILKGMSPDDAIGLLRAQRSPAVLCNPAFEAALRHEG